MLVEELVKELKDEMIRAVATAQGAVTIGIAEVGHDLNGVIALGSD